MIYFNKIAKMLNPNEEVFVVARQSSLKPGGSKFTPNVVFATDRRIIIRGIISEDEFQQMKQDLLKKRT